MKAEVAVSRKSLDDVERKLMEQTAEKALLLAEERRLKEDIISKQTSIEVSSPAFHILPLI